MTELSERIQARINAQAANVVIPRVNTLGKLVKTVGLTLEATGLHQLAVGARCLIQDRHGSPLEAEIVGFTGDISHLMPLDQVFEVSPSAQVVPLPRRASVMISDSVVGRVLNGKGQPLDGKGPLHADTPAVLSPAPINPLTRASISQPLDVGIRAINALTTVGRGQRVGLFAGSGVGKSVLMGMMSQYTEADVAVVGMIGERGREVKEFVEHTLGESGLRKTVVVASPADDPPLLRVQAAMLAASIAEYFRDQGKQVLLLMDSLTRFAQAHREIAIATGEPPATKGYSPSVFFRLTQLVERAGCSATSGGSVTAFYTVLTEGDDLQDPVADSARAILDGHLVLSRRLAEQGLYPAIDIEASISRAMAQIVDERWTELARALKKCYAHYRSNQDMITVGAYRRGSDPRLDEAIQLYPKIFSFIQQKTSERVDLNHSRAAMEQLVRGMGQAQAPQVQQSEAR
jgi:flagellum-specific ATP synthase